MGEGNMGGNGSVKWTIRHHNTSGSQAAITARHGGSPNPGNHEVIDATGDAQGLDPISFADIGVRHGRQGFFKVTLAGQAGPLYVQAVDRTGGKNADVPIEIKIEW